MNDNIDPNKIIQPFSDCRGTCKTPIGCTCGKMVNEEDLEEDFVYAKKKEVEIVAVADVEASENESEQPVEGKKVCKCGRNKKDEKVPCCSGTHKLEVYDWLEEMSDLTSEYKMVEVQFKNTRKGYYLNSNNLELFKGDIVAVEATPGHDIGEVTLTGKLVGLQMKKSNFRGDIKRVYRIAKPNDLEKYEQAKAKEHKTMLRAREIAEELQLDMKISDVEFQGDGNKAIFYYIADGRVDFRQLIKHYASEFRVKIEMKQIGARQEAGRVGGIGPCGRELCCSSSMSNFISVSTSAARIQDIPLNPQKLAGQCGKLKCCLNFEVDTYVEAQRKLPSRDTVLETKDSSYFHFKTDVLSGNMTYSTDKYFAANLVTLPREKVFEVIKQNRRGEKPVNLADHSVAQTEDKRVLDVLEQESITRFDDQGGGKSNKNNSNNGKKRRNKSKELRKNGDNGNNGNERNNNPNGNAANQQKPRVRQEGENSEKGQREQGERPVRKNFKRNNNRNRQNREQNNNPKNNNPKSED